MTPTMQVLTVAFIAPLVISGIYVLIVTTCSNNQKPEELREQVEIVPVELERAA